VTYPQPVPATAKVTVLMDFISGLGWNVTQETGFPLFPGPEILTSPDRAVFLTPTSGPGWVTEEAALDCWGFQFLLRGAADDPVGAQLAAQQLDVLILNGPYPQAVDGVVIAVAGRSGGPPAPLPLNPEDRRFEYACTYLITTGLE
jgi:hypothetical protein